MIKSPPPSKQAFNGLREASEYLEQAIDYEKAPGVKYVRRNFNLRRMEALLKRLGNPHEHFNSIHIAGTKGKGSSGAIIESCLRRAGVRTGLYSSPHLSSVCERISINGTPVSEDSFCALLGEMKPLIDELRKRDTNENPTYFELTTALSFAAFASAAVQWAVIEVGLGGRLDATNVLSPEICLITPIGYDHMDKLGDTAAEIASEKAGILKPGVPLILARQDYPEALAAIRQRADELECGVWEVGEHILTDNHQPLISLPGGKTRSPGWTFDISGPGWRYENLFTPLLGRHQVYNATSAAGTLELLKQKEHLQCPPEAVRAGIGTCKCPGRVEMLQKSPPLVLDTAHTLESVAALKETLSTHFPGYRISLIFGCSDDKNHEGMLAILAGVSDSVTVTRSASPRAEAVDTLANSARRAGFARTRECSDPAEALRQTLAEARAEDLTCVTGSFFLAGSVREMSENIGSLYNPQKSIK